MISTIGLVISLKFRQIYLDKSYWLTQNFCRRIDLWFVFLLFSKET